MYEIHVAKMFNAPAETVFRRVADHERFLSGPGMTCRLVREGRDDRNGLGAVREVNAGGTVFTEEVTAFDPPRRFEYVIRKVINRKGRPTPLAHELGWVVVTPQGTSCQVDWLSRFSITIPLVGWIVERVLGPRVAKSFLEALERANVELREQAAAVGPSG